MGLEIRQETIVKVDDEYIVVSGMVHGIDTSQWPQGIELQSSNAIPGEWMEKALETEKVTFTARVIESHPTLGSMLVLPATANNSQGLLV